MTLPEVDPELGRLLSLTREATLPDPGARGRIRASLDARLAAGAGSPVPGAARGLWLGFGAAVVGVAAVGVWLSGVGRESATFRPTSMTPAPVSSSATNAPLFAAPPAVAAASAVEPVARAMAGSPARTTEPGRLVTPVAPSGVSSGARDSADELTLVRAMQQALRVGNASQALALVAEHSRRFPKGSLIEEREGVRAIASCQSAQSGARAAIFATFSQRFGASPYASRVKAACQ